MPLEIYRLLFPDAPPEWTNHTDVSEELAATIRALEDAAEWARGRVDYRLTCFGGAPPAEVAVWLSLNDPDDVKPALFSGSIPGALRGWVSWAEERGAAFPRPLLDALRADLAAHADVDFRPQSAEAKFWDPLGEVLIVPLGRGR